MAFYIVRYDGGDYINETLCQKFYAGGERSFIKLLAKGEITGQVLFDQILYPVTAEEREDVAGRFEVQIQDFDAQYRQIHVVGRDEQKIARTYPDAAVVRTKVVYKGDLFQHRFTTFLSFRDFEPAQGARHTLLGHMAAVRVCKFWYIALDAVNITVDRPVIVTAS
jgi:hypothetical protein